MRTIRVRRERPTAVSWAIALAITMLIVYLLTLDVGRNVVVESVSAAPRITREVSVDKQEMYIISMCKCNSAAEARMQAAGFTARGAAGYAYEADDGWHVLGAAYDREKDAKRIAQRLKDDEGIEATVLTIGADSVAMRITAPETQIEAIINADQIMRDQTFQLGDMALQLDRGEIKPDAVRTLCALAATEAGDAAKTIQGIPGAAENGLCAALIDRLNHLKSLLDAIIKRNDTSTTDLSGMLRCAQIDNFIGHCGLQAGLEG